MEEEPGLYIEQLHLGGIQTNWGGDGRPISRQPIYAEQVWTAELSSVPAANPLPSATSADGDTAAAGAVIIRKALPLEPDPAGPAPYRYRAQAPGDIRKVIPATWGVNAEKVTVLAGSYAPELQGSLGAVAYDPQAWTLDGSLHALEFIQDAEHVGLPAGAAPPFTLTYWEYGGPTAGSGGGGGGGVADGTNLGGGSEVFVQTTLGGIMEFRTLTPGIGTDMAQSATEIEIHSGVVAATQPAHGLAPGQPVYWSGAAWAPARANSQLTLATHLIAAVPDANTLRLTNSGLFSLGGVHGFAPGAWLFVSAAAAGTLTSVEPGPPAFSNPIALATTTVDLLAFPFRGSQAGGAPLSGSLANHLRGGEAFYEPAGGGAAAAPAAYGAAAAPAAAGFAPAGATVARWGAFAPHGFGGGTVFADVRFIAPAGGVAFRAGVQPIKPGDSVAAFAPVYGPAVVAVSAGGSVVAAAPLTVGGTAGLAGGEPFWLYLERAAGNAGDTSAGIAAAHDVFLRF